ncbi:NB-ARC domain-containing protein, partial [Streptomyces sp. NPDC059524]|uniref:NB-ARC domain-containing protein n=1 Tax=Streptomyces sp. NPDC059524 TaxID=3346856 RepID=UPI00369717AB
MVVRRLGEPPAGAPGPARAAAGAPGGTIDGADGAGLDEVLYARTRGRRILVVLDDVVSEAQVRPLLTAAPDLTVMLTGRQALGALEEARHLVLDVFEPAEALELLTRCGGEAVRAAPRDAAEIARLCGNLPLALRVAAAGLAARPHWKAADLVARLADERTRLAALAVGDLDVRGSLLAAYRQAGVQERLAFRLLGLAPLPDFPLWSAAALLACPPPEAERHLEELVRGRLLEARPAPGRLTPVRYGFHPLLRSLSLELLGAGSPGATDRLCRAFLALARYADHRLAPGRDRLAAPVEPPAGIDPHELVGDAALSWFQEESAGLLEAVRRAHTDGLWELCSGLAAASAGYYEAGAVWDDWELSHGLGLDAARQAGDARAEAVLLQSLADLDWQRRLPTAALDRYRLAWHLFTQAGDRVSAARCLSGEADVLLGQGRVPRAERGYVRALSGARTTGDARGAAHALRGLALVALREGRSEEALARLAECERWARRTGDRRWQEYALRTTRAVAAGAAPAGRPLEVRPGMWLLSAPETAPA